MPMTATVHIGSIDKQNERLCTVVKGSRHDVIYALNQWLFDYFRDLALPIKQLPPLDDWSRDGNKWYIRFPYDDWIVVIDSDIVEFR